MEQKNPSYLGDVHWLHEENHVAISNKQVLHHRGRTVPDIYDLRTKSKKDRVAAYEEDEDDSPHRPASTSNPTRAECSCYELLR